MESRRARERRRESPARRYNFAETALPDEESVEAAPDEELDEVNVPTRTQTAVASRAVSARDARSDEIETDPMSAYLWQDLRRVGLVVGGLLVALLILYFVLPH